MIELNPKNLRFFLEGKEVEMAHIIRQNYRKTPEQIANILVKTLNCSSLSVFPAAYRTQSKPKPPRKPES